MPMKKVTRSPLVEPWNIYLSLWYAYMQTFFFNLLYWQHSFLKHNFAHVPPLYPSPVTAVRTHPISLLCHNLKTHMSKQLYNITWATVCSFGQQNEKQQHLQMPFFPGLSCCPASPTNLRAALALTWAGSYFQIPQALNLSSFPPSPTPYLPLLWAGRREKGEGKQARKKSPSQGSWKGNAFPLRFSLG